MMMVMMETIALGDKEVETKRRGKYTIGAFYGGFSNVAMVMVMTPVEYDD